MRTTALAALLVLAAASASAQNPPAKQPPAKQPPAKSPPPTAGQMSMSQMIHIPAGVAGTWEGKSLTAKDSVITTFVLTATQSATGWKSKLATRPEMALRIIAAGGDSVVTEMGPYESVLRPGVQTTTRNTIHFKSDMATGTFVGNLTNGEKITGKTTATRKK